MKEDKDIWPAILLKYFQEDANPSEVEKVEEWLKTEENRENYEQWVETWRLAGFSHKQDFNSEKAFSNIRPSIKRQIHVNWVRLVGIAATLLLLFAVGWYIFVPEDNTYYSHDERNVPVALKDGSKVSLNKHSKLKINQSIISVTRSVNLEGAAFFQVEKSEDPFHVHTHDAFITVLGTEFMVEAHPGQPTEVIVKSGKVKVEYIDTRENIILEKGETVRKNKDITIKKVNENLNYLSWKTGKFTFREEPLERVFKTLEKHYNASFVYKNEYLEGCKLSATFDNLTLTELLEILETAYDIETKKQDTVISITDGGC